MQICHSILCNEAWHKEKLAVKWTLFCICWLLKKALFLLRTIEHNPVTKSILINVLTSIVPLEVHFTLLFEAISTELIICIGLYLFEFHGLFPQGSVSSQWVQPQAFPFSSQVYLRLRKRFMHWNLSCEKRGFLSFFWRFFWQRIMPNMFQCHSSLYCKAEN